MKTTGKLATAVTASTMLLVATTHAWASEQYSFPSQSGALIVATTPTFVAPTAGADAKAATPYVSPYASSSVAVTGAYVQSTPPALTSGRSYDERFGVRSRAAEAYAFHFLTHALNSASYANYAADYARLFAPGYAVSTWTDRVFGTVDAGYGGAVDSWTAASYYMPRLRGPARRRESAPDLSTMPQFRSHPELDTHPTFGKGS